MSRLGRFVKKFKLSPTIMFYTLELIERKSFEYKIVDDLEQISFLLNILQKEQVSLSVRLSRNIWCSYYSLLSPSSVWSDSSSNKSKRFEFESNSDYSQGPASRKVANVKTPQNRLKPSVGGLELDYVFLFL